ncbi:hypothetical protein SKAU_G00243280 [Synaphobranchus kaupii]|uniref:Uncharacterized protein n=1 Tax=Synaphobranchus kaupii TaxID=118154 RepID=A0A9Q1F7Y3_SYNKA|nr:hypothetical protein SKAU_G00243280 [Synaphobranchus kaupii]
MASDGVDRCAGACELRWDQSPATPTLQIRGWRRPPRAYLSAQRVVPLRRQGTRASKEHLPFGCSTRTDANEGLLDRSTLFIPPTNGFDYTH